MQLVTWTKQTRVHWFNLRSQYEATRVEYWHTTTWWFLGFIPYRWRTRRREVPVWKEIRRCIFGE